MLVRTMYVSAVLLLSLASCQKHIDKVADAIDPQAEPGESITTNAFEACHCSEDSVEFIKGIFNDVPMCFNAQVAVPDSFGNAYYYQAGVQDQMNLIRQNTDGTLICEFFLSNSDLYHKALPYTLPHPNLAYCEHTELTLLDMRQSWASQCQGCEMDDADYFGETWSGLSFTISDTTGGYVKGTFQGSAATKTGRSLQVKNGSFNIHIYQEPMNTGGNGN